MTTRGQCLCGGYQFTVKGEFSAMMDCYCSMCRKAHGAAYATFVGCAAVDFDLERGADLVSEFQSSAEGKRFFCRTCGSNLPMHHGADVYIPAGLLDDDPGVRTSAHMFATSKAPWVEILDQVPQYEGYPGQ